jgi:hypothetical protein
VHTPTRETAITAAKLVLAALELTTLASVAGAQIAPGVPLTRIVVFALGLFAVVVAGVIAVLTFYQFILRNGGTDPQWFWFSGEPRGLVALREQAKQQESKQL